MKTIDATPKSSAAGVTWDLTPLYASTHDDQLGNDLELATARASAFEQNYRGKVAELDATELHNALVELQELRELMDTPAIYAHLLHAGKTDEPEHGRLVALTQETSTAINRHLIFFELEWVQVVDDHADTLLKDPALKDFAYMLELERRYKPHRLPEGEENILDEKANTGSRAWGRLFEELTSRLTAEVTIDGQTKTLSQAETLALSYHPNRETRKSAADGMTEVLRSNLHPLGYVFNVRLQDHASDDRIRRYSSPMAARCLSNQIEQSSVDALVFLSCLATTVSSKNFLGYPSCLIMTATRHLVQICRPTTGRPHKTSCWRATTSFPAPLETLPGGRLLNAGLTPNCARASVVARSAWAGQHQRIRTFSPITPIPSVMS